MEASKVTVRPEYIRFTKLTPGRRSALRRQNIKDLIRSKPAGTVIKLKEFASVTQSDLASVSSMLKTMVSHGDISKLRPDIPSKSFCWTVNDNITVEKTAIFPAQDATTDVKMGLDASLLIKQAKEYYWDKDGDDSLKGFIKWINGEE